MPAAAGANAEAEAALLTIQAIPWAEARLDGKLLGSTPRRALRTRSGAHTLVLECPPLGRKARVALKLASGAHAHVLADMQTDPPTVSVK